MENEHEALDRLISAEQDERRRLALFLHDGPVQQLSGIALMLDGALHSLGDGALDAGARDHRHGARPPAGRRSASCAISRSRSSRSCSATTASRPALRALADQAGELARDRVRGRHRATRRRSATTASIALYTIIRELIDQSVRRGPPTPRSRSPSSPTDDGGLVASVADDAEPERRRRSLETIDERARQLHGTLEVARRRRRDRHPRHAARPHRPALT